MVLSSCDYPMENELSGRRLFDWLGEVKLRVD